MKIVFVRPPCHLWPIINESDNFLMPLSFPGLGAYLKQEMDDVSVKVIDCLPLKIGYQTLYQMLKEENPDVVGVGDSLPYIYEGLKVLKMAKEINPNVITIAGGHFHSHLPEYSLSNHPELDYVVRYEGELPLKELLEALRNDRDLTQVQSIAFRRNNQIVETEPAPVISNLDDLPIPDYELMPVERYSPFGKLWPKAATIQASRGCPMNCEYCSWSSQEGEHVIQDGEIVLKPKLRQKSVERVIEEIDLLYHRYQVRYLFWVDGTFNFNTQWMDQLCDEIIKRKYKLGWWAFLRADLLLEQEKSGVLEKMVTAGLKHTLFGGERCNEADMKLIGKTGMKGMELMHASQLLKKKYPGVFRQATFITGIRSETETSIEELGQYARKIDLDFAAFHPIMPYPGTPLWKTANQNDWIEEKDFSKYDMFYPVMASDHLSRTQIAQLTQKLYQDYVGKRPLKYLQGLFSPVKIRRKLHWWFLYSTMRVILRDAVLSFKQDKKMEGFAAISKLWKPSWYDQ